MHFSSTWLFLLGVPLLQASDNTGVRMTTQFGNSGPSALWQRLKASVVNFFSR